MSDFRDMVDLAAARLGGVVLEANDEFFAEKENLLRPQKPVFIADKYTDRGKWMDGWETRRRRVPGHDWCVVRLGLAGIVRGVVVDTSFFAGNFPSHCSLDASAAESDGAATAWAEIVPKSELRGDFENVVPVADERRFTHVRLNIFPDGGVARLRVHGEVLPDWPSILAGVGEVNVSSVEHGGRAVGCSDGFYSHPQNLLMPYPAANMGDGWETKRRRGPGHDWAIVRLGIESIIRRVEVDTTHFKGNYPDACSLDAAQSATDPDERTPWEEALSPTKLRPDATHVFELRLGVLASHVRLNIHPDGGVSRLRIHGTPTRAGLVREGLRALNAAGDGTARTALIGCCGSRTWVDRMVAARPFSDIDDLMDEAETIWNALAPADWRDAFAHHPRIGDRGPAPAQPAPAHTWSVQEQSRAQSAAPEVLTALAGANRAYEDRFGHVFIVCATGRSSEEILALLRQRLENDPGRELEVAAAEQARITRLRLEKLLGA
jgi:allantoicase